MERKGCCAPGGSPPPESDLRLLGAVRRYLVTRLFECLCKGSQFVALGSTNVTSDFDLTILGEHANDCMRGMFHRFLAMYGNTLAQAFDTNLYTIGYHLVTPRMRRIPASALVPGTPWAVFVSRTPRERRTEVEWAAAKLANCAPRYRLYVAENYPAFAPCIRRAEGKVKRVKHMIRTEHSATVKKYGRKYSNRATLRLITRYNLYYTIAQTLYAQYLYDNVPAPAHGLEGVPQEMRNLFDLLGIANYVSVEAYYTSASVIFVVLLLQGKKSVSIGASHYLCAALENLGDLIHHMSNEGGTFGDALLLKYSKYVYRLYRALGYLEPEGAFAAAAAQIEEEVLPHRGRRQPVPQLARKLGLPGAESADAFLRHVIDAVCPTLARFLPSCGAPLI